MGHPGQNLASVGREHRVAGMTIPEWMQQFIRSFGYAFEGLRYTLRTQRNFRVHLGFMLAVLILGLWLGITVLEWALLVVMVCAVLLAELFNTVIEVLVDMVQPTYHPLAKVIKDVSAGAVLISAMASVVVGLLVMGPDLWVRVFIP